MDIWHNRRDIRCRISQALYYLGGVLSDTGDAIDNPQRHVDEFRRKRDEKLAEDYRRSVALLKERAAAEHRTGPC